MQDVERESGDCPSCAVILDGVSNVMKSQDQHPLPRETSLWICFESTRANKLFVWIVFYCDEKHRGDSDPVLVEFFTTEGTCRPNAGFILLALLFTDLKLSC